MPNGEAASGARVQREDGQLWVMHRSLTHAKSAPQSRLTGHTHAAICLRVF